MITNTKLLEIALQAHTTYTEALKSNIREETEKYIHLLALEEKGAA